MRFRRLRARVWKAMFWGMVLVLTSLAGGLWFAYAYVTDSATLAGLIKAEGPRYLAGARLELSKARVRPFVGEINLTQVALRQVIDGSPFVALKIPWLHIRHSPRAMLRRQFVPSEVVVAQPTLRLRRRKDGTWNLQGLLADPWPGPTVNATPPILIQNGTVELCDGDARAAATVLRGAMVRIESAGDGRLRFEGSAKGDAFERLALSGTIDRASGRVTLRGDMAGLAISETLRGRLPVEVRPACDQAGLSRGEVDLWLGQLVYDPQASPTIHYEASARLRAGVWNCRKLPFPINELSASVSVRDGRVTIERAEGYNGTTTVRVSKGSLALGDPARVPIDLQLDIIDLELDQRLRTWTPPEFAELWTDFQPRGRISAAVHVVRATEGGPVGFGWTVDCRDVAMSYRYFTYPIDHIQGRLTFEKQQIQVDLRTLLGNKPLHAWGTIDDPGPEAHVLLQFEGGALPIDKTLLDAIPPDIRAVVDQFQPSGTVRGRARVERFPPRCPRDPPEGRITLDADLDLNERCAIKWAGLPYPVEDLTGHLEVHPDSWIFTDMRGGNGMAVITGSGRVERLEGPGDPLKVDLHLNAERLPFDDQLRTALPKAWQKTWSTINPIGSSDVDATIRLAPGQPDHYHLVIDPRPDTNIRLEFSREPRPGIDPGGTFSLPMENVTGRFIYDNGTVSMRDVGFRFFGAPVQFESGMVRVEESGRFQLGVTGVWARDFRLDARLRAIMPPVMAKFAQRFDEGTPLSTIKGNLGLNWPGPNQPVACTWDHVLVVFNDNTVQSGVPLEHIQGQLDHVRGQFDGDHLDIHGALKLDSVSLLGQQVTELESPFQVAHDLARLDDIRGKLLGGELDGQFEVSLDSTPRYAASLAVRGADLQSYAKTLPGRQAFRGLVFARLDFNGLGNDLRTLQGQGSAEIIQGDLGELPVVLRLFNVLKQPTTKTAFDTAYVAIAIQNGESLLDPIKLTGNAISLLGRGKLDVRGDLDMRLKVILGRDRIRVPIVSGVLREATGQIFAIRVRGTPAYPKFMLEPLPTLSEIPKSINNFRGPRERH
ncbi:MAG: hypothetical protein JOZ63_09670 [Planctomycetaceae bacterium]|nr:hypothetical protein [Planctomycetaceae bacterium]